jgi:Protein of unknown function (DUF4238)
MKNKETENDKPTPQGQITARQHFVPQFYLKKFVNSSGFIEVLDISRKTILEPRVPKAVCYEKFFYGTTTGELDDVSQQVEKQFQQWEDSLAKQIEPIIAKLLNNSQIDDKEKWVIAFLMSMLWIRGPAMREQINRMSEEVMKHVNKLRFSHPSTDSLFDEFDRETGSTTTPEMREKLKRTMTEGDYSLKFNNASHLHMFDSFQGFANLFHAQDWLVYIAKSDKKFTTSDNPITVVVPDKEGFYGPTFLERDHYFPLTPDLLIKGRYPEKDLGKKLRRKTLFKQDDFDILKLNLTTANHVVQYAYATERQSLEDLLSAVERLEQLQSALTKNATVMG